MNNIFDLKPNPNDWTVAEVKEWLNAVGLEEYANFLCDIHHIDGHVLMSLSFNDLISFPLSINIYGDAKKIMLKVSEMKSKIRKFCCSSPIINSKNPSETTSEVTSDEELSRIVESGQNILTSRFETKRCLISFIYLFISCYFTALTMAIVHNRVPDMSIYPPLPDILLENLPLINWAFKASEIFMILNFFVWCFILVFHKYRFILIKRYCGIFGTVFLLRCFTMLSTSLSVPGKHHKCIAQTYNGWKSTLIRSFEIMGYAGMSINGVKSCGDYMFSGHTVCHTLMTLFISQYTPKNFHRIKFISKFLAIFGMFLILAAHEHYTLDVICAIYVCVKTFSNYHVLITARKLSKNQTKCWNPIFYYLEKPIETAKVPNIYENPAQFVRIMILKIKDYLSYFGNARRITQMSTNREFLSNSSYQQRRNFRRGTLNNGRYQGRGGRRMESLGNFHEVPKKVFNVPPPMSPSISSNNNEKTDSSTSNTSNSQHSSIPQWTKPKNQIDLTLDPTDYPSLDSKNRSKNYNRNKSIPISDHVSSMTNSDEKLDKKSKDEIISEKPVDVLPDQNINNIHEKKKCNEITDREKSRYSQKAFINPNKKIPGSVVIMKREEILRDVPISCQLDLKNTIKDDTSTIKNHKYKVAIYDAKNTLTTNQDINYKKSNDTKNSFSAQNIKICTVNSDGSVTFTEILKDQRKSIPKTDSNQRRKNFHNHNTETNRVQIRNLVNISNRDNSNKNNIQNKKEILSLNNVDKSCLKNKIKVKVTDVTTKIT